MFIKIEIDTREALSIEDKAILRAIGYMDEDAPAPSPAAATKAPAAKTAAKKAAASTPSEPDSEPEAAADESPLDDEEGLRNAALARASSLLSSGHRDVVMAALSKAGGKKVSEVPAENLHVLLDALGTDDD